MNLRYWSKQHTYGLLIGIVTVFLASPIVEIIYPWIDNSSFLKFDYYWDMFFTNDIFRCKILSISVIANLTWFYWSLNRRKYNFTTGIILGSMAFIPYIVYIQFVK